MDKELSPLTEERPIIFSTGLIPQILDETKTMTRRIIKPQPDIQKDGYYIRDKRMRWQQYFTEKDFINKRCRFKIGNILWVKETYLGDNKGNIIYKASIGNMDLWKERNKEKWKPAIFMPRKYARIFLKIIDVKIERLQDIKMIDIEKEGIIKENCNTDEALELWINCWNSLNKERGFGWDANPFVWRITFKKIK